LENVVIQKLGFETLQRKSMLPYGQAVCRRMIHIIVLWRNKASFGETFRNEDIRSAINSRSSLKGTAIWCNVFRPTAAAAAVGGSEKYFSAKIGVPQRYTKGVKRAQLFKRLCSISNSGIYVERILTFPEFSGNISASNLTRISLTASALRSHRFIRLSDLSEVA